MRVSNLAFSAKKTFFLLENFYGDAMSDNSPSTNQDINVNIAAVNASNAQPDSRLKRFRTTEPLDEKLLAFLEKEYADLESTLKAALRHNSQVVAKRLRELAKVIKPATEDEPSILKSMKKERELSLAQQVEALQFSSVTETLSDGRKVTVVSPVYTTTSSRSTITTLLKNRPSPEALLKHWNQSQNRAMHRLELEVLYVHQKEIYQVSLRPLPGQPTTPAASANHMIEVPSLGVRMTPEAAATLHNDRQIQLKIKEEEQARTAEAEKNKAEDAKKAPAGTDAAATGKSAGTSQAIIQQTEKISQNAASTASSTASKVVTQAKASTETSSQTVASKDSLTQTYSDAISKSASTAMPAVNQHSPQAQASASASASTSTTPTLTPSMGSGGGGGGGKK